MIGSQVLLICNMVLTEDMLDNKIEQNLFVLVLSATNYSLLTLGIVQNAWVKYPNGFVNFHALPGRHIE